MKKYVYILIVLFCTGCACHHYPMLDCLEIGMDLSEVRAIKAINRSLKHVGRSSEYSQFRAWFVEDKDNLFFCQCFPVRLTFNNDKKLIEYKQDYEEEIRREIAAQTRRIESAVRSLQCERWSQQLFEHQRIAREHRKMKELRNSLLAQQSTISRLNEQLAERQGRARKTDEIHGLL